MTKELALGKHSLVIEAASNDGYLLQYFDALGVPSLGIEPTRSTADAARDKGLQVVQEFLTRETADVVVEQFGQADLVVANNVIAHVPDLPDFISALGRLVKTEGVVSVEFPRVDRLVRLGQFDTVYHEHFSYLSLTSLRNALMPHGLRIVDVVSLETHGGSYRALIRRDASKHSEESDRLKLALEAEDALGVASVHFYEGLESLARSCKLDLLEFLTGQRRRGAPVVAYGAAAKGNTLFNYCGIKEDLVQAVIDRSPGKVGRFLPGSRIPIRPEESLAKLRPANVLVLPWNLSDEIARQLAYVHEWGAELVTAVPLMSRIPLP
jgi:SAM-dependent methyltransferase